MTRINLFIDVQDLCDQHLLAENREITRIYSVLAKRLAKLLNLTQTKNELSHDFTKRVLSHSKNNPLPDWGVDAVLKGCPPCFTLGEGHTLFFLDKLQYIQSRYNDLFSECIQRGFKPKQKILKSLPEQFYNGCTASDDEVARIQALLKDRINQQIPSQGPRYHGRVNYGKFFDLFPPQKKEAQCA